MGARGEVVQGLAEIPCFPRWGRNAKQGPESAECVEVTGGAKVDFMLYEGGWAVVSESDAVCGGLDAAVWPALSTAVGVDEALGAADEVPGGGFEEPQQGVDNPMKGAPAGVVHPGAMLGKPCVESPERLRGPRSSRSRRSSRSGASKRLRPVQGPPRPRGRGVGRGWAVLMLVVVAVVTFGLIRVSSEFSAGRTVFDQSAWGHHLGEEVPTELRWRTVRLRMLHG